MSSPPEKVSEAEGAAPAWGSLGRVVEVQAHNALNDKVAQFILLALAEVLAISQYYPQTISILLVLPQLFFAPLAGWISDRFSKRRILIWCSLSQVFLLLAIGGAFLAHEFWIGTALFFGLAFQASVFAPAKAGILKELVGEKHLTTASGWIQMTTMVAFAVGQLIGGKSFEHYHDPWRAAAVPILVLAAFSIVPLLLSLQVKRTPTHSDEPFHRGLFTDHFLHLGELFRVRNIRLSALGVSFFWLAALMLTLILIELAAEIEPNKAARVALSSEMLGFVAGGVALGSFLTSWISAQRIELGLVPLGGVTMALASLAGFFVEPGGGWFCLCVLGIGLGSALFLIPLNAFLMDQVEPSTRGRMLSAAGLLDSLGMMAGVGLQLLLMKLGVGIQWQLMVLGVLSLAASVIVLRIIPQNFLRFLTLSLIRFVYRVRILNPERVPTTGPALIVSNHVTYLDAFMVSSATTRDVRFTAYEAFFKGPILGQLLRLFGVIPISNRRAKDAIVTMSDTLKGGDLVGIFPEGQLTRSGLMNEIRKGFELIARRSGAPVIPVYLDDLWGSVFSFERGRFFRKHPHHFPYHASVLWGQPIPAESATVETCTAAFRSLASEALRQRGEVRRGLREAVASALARAPWKIAVMAGDGSERTLRRGELLGRALQLARRWQRLPSPHLGLLLADGIDRTLASVAVVMAGKVAVIVDPAVPHLPADLHTVITSVADRERSPAFPWSDHVLDLQTELEEIDELHLMADIALVWAMPALGMKLRLRLAHLGHEHDECGAGYVTRDGHRVDLTGHDLLLQSEMIRGTDLLRGTDTLLIAQNPASSAGLILGLWTGLLRGLTFITTAPSLTTAKLARLSSQIEPTVAIGSADFATTFQTIQSPRTRLIIATDGPPYSATEPSAPYPLVADDLSGGIYAISLVNPPLATSTAEPQFGRKENGYGKLLPGVEVLSQPHPAPPILRHPNGRTHTLPEGLWIDPDGFILIAS
jgi:acyl-[acyl-carrier-protein]-phospholipid O-acyltransferase / long-chain-fatty-acid--[acyl-carrier-protein] ligase